MTIYPIPGNAHLVNADLISTFLNALFMYAEPGEGCLMIRGVGEKGTEQYGGQLRETVTLPIGAEAAATIAEAARRWGQWHGGTFIVPAVMSIESLADKDGSEDRVLLFPCFCLDLDKGNTDGLIVEISNAIGLPTLIVESGGTTEAGTPKLHVYWRFNEMVDEIDRVCRLREVLALKTGGDASFKRAPQIIRVPGSIHCKNGGARPVTIRHCNITKEYGLGDLAERIMEMRFLVEASPEVQAQARGPVVKMNADGLLDFSDVGRGAKPIGDTLTTQIHEGGQGGETRWDNFNRVWGHYLHCVRKGEMTIAEADAMCRGWIAANMVPAWDETRIRTEMKGLYDADVGRYGPMPQPVTASSQVVAAMQHQPGSIGNLASWAVHRWKPLERQSRRFIVRGLIQESVPHVFAAESGSGKSMAMLDLMIRVAAKAARPDLDLKWMGETISDAVAGRPVVFFTAEDDALELSIRMHDIDTDRLHMIAGDHLIVVPLPSAGGVFPLVQRNQGGVPMPSPQWQVICQQWASWPKKPAMVGLDTFNSMLHGEDTRGDIVQEFINELQRSASAMGVASVMSHHLRKGNGQPIRTLEEMTDMVRGSTALKAGARVVLGMFHATDYRRRLKQMKMPTDKNTCFRFGVIKANNPEMFDGMKTLVRQKSGIMMDMTSKDKLADGPGIEHEAWLTFAMQKAAASRHAFTTNGDNGLYKRRGQLPDLLRSLGQKEIQNLAGRCVAKGMLVQGRLAKGGASEAWLDVPGGPVSRGQGYRDDGDWKYDWDDFDYRPEIGKIMHVNTPSSEVSDNGDDATTRTLSN